MKFHFSPLRSERASLICMKPVSFKLPGSSVYGIIQTRILEWVAIPFSRESSWLRDRTWVSCIVGGFLNVCAIREAHTVKSWRREMRMRIYCGVINKTLWNINTMNFFSKLKYSCFTVLCQSLPYRKVTQLYTYKHSVSIFFSIMVYPSRLDIVPCAIQ